MLYQLKSCQLLYIMHEKLHLKMPAIREKVTQGKNIQEAKLIKNN